MRHLCGYSLEGIEPARQGHPAIVAPQLNKDSRLARSAASLDHPGVLRFEADDLRCDLRRGR
jgi:hypothetical protein